ncbi:MAG: aldo/keto reductase [Candidatus Krumholzibacteriota bacterium]|nr:aldo/keto reductase [Candidatus Krumholzibacteriota bacterium]
MGESKKRISRRSFLGRSTAGILGAGLGLSAGSDAWGQDRTSADDRKQMIRGYRPFGRTGYKVSDISFGNAGMQDCSLLEYAMERGINYVDTARQYYDMEKVIGQIFPQKRGKLFVTTKLEPELFTTETTEQQIQTAIEESLKRLNTDYVDGCLVHSVGDPNLGGPERIRNPAIINAFLKAKKAGKIRFWGASSHGPKMVEDFEWLLDNTDIDIIMPGMNFLTKGLEPVLARARSKKVAVVAMKSMSAAKKIDYSKYMKDGRTARQGLIKWMLGQPNIDTISISMRSFEEVDEFVAASGDPRLSSREKKVLNGYASLLSGDYCRPGCDGCLEACPHRVPIHDILRYRLYFNNYGREKYAMGLYASLPEEKKASRCSDCAGQCAGSCPYGLEIKSRLIMAHGELTV